MELLEGYSNTATIRYIDIGMKLISAIMLGVLSWHLVISGIDAHQFGEATLTLLISFGPFFILLAIGILLYLLVLLAEIWLLLKGYSTKYRGE